MNNVYYDVRLDIKKDTVIDSGLRFTQGDKSVLYLRLAVMDNGGEFDSKDAEASINFVKPDGECVVGLPVKNENFWVYQILGNELQAPGKVLCDMKFTYASGRISSSKFTFIVEKDTMLSGAIKSSSYIGPLEEILGEMTNYKNQGYSLVEAATNKVAESDARVLLAESWAVGGTGVREDEDSDNAKFYKEWVENAFAMKIPELWIDFDTGVMYYKGGVLAFDIDENGELEWFM